MTEIPVRSLVADTLLMGAGTPYVITLFSEGGKPEGKNGDKQRSRSDGVTFGRDRLGGRLFDIEVSINVETYGQAQLAWKHLQMVWDSEEMRSSPGATIPLRIRQEDGPARVVFGRPRECTPVDMSRMYDGRLDVVMTFKAIDHKYYSDVMETNDVSIIPPSTGFITTPITTPITTYGSSHVQSDIHVEGEASAWLVSEVTGPLEPGAEVDVPGQFRIKLRDALNHQQTLRIDPQPWSRGVYLDGEAIPSGAFTVDSPRLSHIALPPGDYNVILRGKDPTGTASMLNSWRHGYLTL